MIKNSTETFMNNIDEQWSKPLNPTEKKNEIKIMKGNNLDNYIKRTNLNSPSLPLIVPQNLIMCSTLSTKLSPT